MIKSILVPATGSDSDNAVFASALAIARVFDSHLDFLHVRVDAAAVAATMAMDGAGSVMIAGLVDKIDEESKPPGRNGKTAVSAVLRARAAGGGGYSDTRRPARSFGEMAAGSWGRVPLGRRARPLG